MTALYVSLVAAVLAAFVGMFWLRRIADRSWAMHRATRPLVKDWVRFQIVVVDRLTPALRQMAEEMVAMTPKVRALAEAFRQEKR